ncbi:MAG: iron-sulfur cluster assembly scaffold protein [Pseudomonadota bacterium]
MNAPLYTTDILRLAASLEAPHALSREDARAELRSPTCGSRIETAVALDGKGRVEALSQKVHACAFGQASAAILQGSAKGRSAEEIASKMKMLGEWLDGGDAPGWPELAALAPARSRKSRHGAILLPFRALLAAIDASK